MELTAMGIALRQTPPIRRLLWRTMVWPISQRQKTVVPEVVAAGRALEGEQWWVLLWGGTAGTTKKKAQPRLACI